MHSFSNGQNAQVNWELPFDQLSAIGRCGQAARNAPVDSTHKKRPAGVPWRALVARIGTIQTDYSLQPDLGVLAPDGLRRASLYLVGLADDPGLAPGGTRVARNGNT